MGGPQRQERRHQARAIQRQLGRQGSTARLEAARMAIQDPRFGAAFDAAMWAATAPWADKIRSVDHVRDLALRILRESFALDLADIDLKIAFDERKLRLRPVLAIDAARNAEQAVRLKAERRAVP